MASLVTFSARRERGSGGRAICRIARRSRCNRCTMNASCRPPPCTPRISATQPQHMSRSRAIRRASWPGLFWLVPTIHALRAARRRGCPRQKRVQARLRRAGHDGGEESKMHTTSRTIRSILTASIAGAAALGLGAGNVMARGQVAVGVTETIASFNPFADSISLGYGIWCQVYGCLGIYDFDKGEYVGMLAERWEVDKTDNNVWTFHLKRGMKRHNDGKELSADDVVHTVNRISTDPQSKQKQNISPIKEVIAVDPYTVKVVTKQPTASLLEYLFDRVFITGKDLYDKHGIRDVDRRYPWGWGPYKLKDLVIGQRIVLEKESSHPDAKPENPDTLIFTIMREPEQRVTALLNNEVQIAQFIPPHLAERVSQSGNAALIPGGSVEIMFLAISPKYKPWDNLKLRQAVCHAIDRDLIIKNVLKGQADRLDGPIGAGQYGFDADYAKKHLLTAYDPAKAKQLVKRSEERRVGKEGRAGMG